MKQHFFLKRLALMALFATLCCLQGFAATYYAKAIAKVSSSGGGKVFVSTTNSTAAAVWGESSEATKTGTSSYTSITFYLFAQADDGYEFDHWATADNSATSASKNNPWSYGFRGTSQNSASPTTNTRYAVFKKKQNYYSALTANATDGGQVFVNTTNSSADAVYANTSSANQNTQATAAPSHDYYLYAQPSDGYDFVGWTTTADGATVSKNNPYNAKVTANSNDSEAPTAATYYAKFAKAELHYSQTTATAQEGGNVFVSTTNSSADAVWAATSTANNSSYALEAPTHTYYYFAQAQAGYEFKGWMAEGSDAVISTNNPYTGTVTANSTDEAAPAMKNLVAKFVTAVPHYSKVILKLNGNNDISNLGTAMIGGKVYVGRTAEEAESAQYEYTSELVQNTWSVDAASHDYYLYAKADDGFEYAGIGTTASATTSFNSTANPYKVTVSATSTDEAAPTEKVYYASFKYAADNKPSVCYGNFTLVAMLVQDDGTGKLVNVESAEAGMLGLNYNPDESGKGAVTTEPTWHAGSSYASEAYSKPYTSGTVYFPFTIFAKANPGYEFVGWASTSTSTNPTQKGTLVDDYSYYYADNYTRTSVSNVNYPGSCGIEGGPKTKKYYAVFKKLEHMDEPTGVTSVEVTAVTGTTELVEGSVSKNFSVDLVLNEDLPYDVPGSDKNAKPVEVLKQFVTVLGANGNKSDVASYSLVYEATDLGQGSQSSGDLSYGTLYSSHTIRLFFPYNIKADTYTVHLPYGLYTTKEGNKTPTYEFTLTVTEDTNPYLTIKKQIPAEGLEYKYTSAGGQFSEDKRDPENGKVDVSNITVEIEFNEIVNSIDHSKASGITLTNTTQGVNYRYTNLSLPAQLFSKVDGRTAIAYPELINGSYTLNIPEGLFVGGAGKVNEAITINFTVSGFNSVQLKPYEMVTDLITPKANDMLQKYEELRDITISYKGETGQAAVVVGNASGIKVQRYTEVINGEGESAKPVRTYYDVKATPSVAVVDGKMVVSFAHALYSGMYEVTIPASMVANMAPGTMTMAEKVNAGYAESPAYSMTFSIMDKSYEANLNISSAKWSSFVAPFDVVLPAGVKAYKVTGTDNNVVATTPIENVISANTPVLLNAESPVSETFNGIIYSCEPVGNTLVGVFEQIEAPVGSYVLQKHTEEVGFYLVSSVQPNVAAGRCYINAGTSADAKVLKIGFGDETAINGITHNQDETNCYDLQGRRVAKPTKGLYIIGGKKIVVR